jgi:hypothetical protein
MDDQRTNREGGGSVKYHEPRTVLSVVVSILCIGLVLLWIRSCTVRDTIWWPGVNHGVEISSLLGHAVLIIESRETSAGGLAPFATHHEEIDPNTTLSFDLDFLGFLYRPESRVVRIDVPFWFLLLVGIGTAAFVRPKGKLKFSVRTLLIAATLVSLILGLIMYIAR